MFHDQEKPLKIASRKHDLVGLRIYDKREDSLPNIGLIPLEDTETNQILYVDTSSKIIREDFIKQKRKKIKKLNTLFSTSGVDLIDISTDIDYVKPLINFFQNRGKR